MPGQIGIARGDADVRFRQHHFHIAQQRAKEGPALRHIGEQRLVRERRKGLHRCRTSRAAWCAPCAQLNTQGIARRSSIAVDLVRLDGRDPIFSVAISAIGVIARKKSLKAGVS